MGDKEREPDEDSGCCGCIICIVALAVVIPLIIVLWKWAFA